MMKLYKEMNSLERKKLYLQSTYVRSLEGLSRFHESIVRNECKKAKELIENYNIDTYIDKNGIIRWKVNGNVPPKEILLLWKYAGKRFDFDKAILGMDIDFNNLRQSMIKREKNLSAEERFEIESNLSAVFGEGSTIVNLLTGNKTKL